MLEQNTDESLSYENGMSRDRVRFSDELDGLSLLPMYDSEIFHIKPELNILFSSFLQNCVINAAALLVKCSFKNCSHNVIFAGQ